MISCAYAIGAVGAGGFFPANNAAVMKAAPQGEFGIASGLLRTFANVGMVFSFAVAILIASQSISKREAFAIFVGTTTLRAASDAALTTGIHAAFYASTALMLVAALLSALRAEPLSRAAAALLRRPGAARGVPTLGGMPAGDSPPRLLSARAGRSPPRRKRSQRGARPRSARPTSASAERVRRFSGARTSLPMNLDGRAASRHPPNDSRKRSGEKRAARTLPNGWVITGRLTSASRYTENYGQSEGGRFPGRVAAAFVFRARGAGLDVVPASPAPPGRSEQQRGKHSRRDQRLGADGDACENSRARGTTVEDLATAQPQTRDEVLRVGQDGSDGAERCGVEQAASFRHEPDRDHSTDVLPTFLRRVAVRKTVSRDVQDGAERERREP